MGPGAEIGYPLVSQLFADFQKAGRLNQENLRKILSDNRDTGYGKAYGFTAIRSEGAYQDKVPLTDYADYGNLGREPGYYTAYPAACTLSTSGTTGVPKEFCLTREALQRYGAYIYEMPYALTGGKTGPHLHMSVFRPAANGKTLLSAAYYRYLEACGALACHEFAGGKGLLFADGVEDVPYVKAWLALGCPNLASIQAVFLYDILLLFGYLERNWQQLLFDMGKKTVGARLDGAFKEQLLACCPTEGRIRELERIFSEGFASPIAGKLWKNLRFVSGIGGKMYQFQGDALQRYTGDIPISYFAYASSECMAGVALKLGRAEYALLPRSGYYEFISQTGQAVPLGSVKAGEIYELAVTTFSGLYRYRTGDLLKIVSFEGHAPVFEVEGRRNQISNIAGEKLDGADIQAAVAGWAEELGVYVSDFCLGVDSRALPYRYCLFVEARGGAEGTWDVCFDKRLRGLSADYDDIRGLGMLGAPQVCRVKAGELARARLLAEGGNVHAKPQVFCGPEHTRRLLKHLSGEGNGSN